MSEREYEKSKQDDSPDEDADGNKTDIPDAN